MSSVFVLTGEESYLLNQSRQKVLAETLGKQAEPANYVHYLGLKRLNKPSIAQFVEAVGTPSLFALSQPQVIEVESFTWLSKAATGKAEETELEELKTLLSAQPANQTLLFIAPKIDRKIKFTKWLIGQPFVTVVDHPVYTFWQTTEASQHLVRLAATRNITLALPAAQKLVEAMGVLLQPLMNEVEKLFVYTRGQPITLEAIQAMLPQSDNTFAMLEAWVQDQPRGPVFATLHELLLHQHPVQLFALTQSYLHNIFSLRYWQQQGLSPPDIAQQVQKHPFKVKKDLELFARVPFSRLETLKQACLDLEWQSKTGQLSDRLAFETLIGL